ncbi:MAG: hypothetical protein ABWZ57_11800 [Mesorhizobium sp.]
MAHHWETTILSHSALVARVAAEMPRFVSRPELTADQALTLLGCIDRCSIAMATLQLHAAEEEAPAEIQTAAETLFFAWRALADEAQASLERLCRPPPGRRPFLRSEPEDVGGPADAWEQIAASSH